MALDKWTNTGLSTLASGIDASQLTATLASGTGSRFPADTFNVVIWASSDFANPIDAADREIVRCTSRAGDVLTIVRGQEGTTGVAHNTVGKTYSVALAVTKRFRDSIFQSLNTVIFAASGTYTKPSNLIAARVIAVGSGGGGGGADTTGAAQAPGGGGGAGSYSESLLLASALGATETVTIGAAGTVGDTQVTPTVGGNGGDCSFGTLVIGKGGTGGGAAADNTPGNGGAGGVAGTGQIALPGGDGAAASAIGAVSPGGHGGSSYFGGAGRGRISAAGIAGKANTGGGGGGGNGDNAVNDGGLGGTGIVIVQEYLNEL